MKWPVLTRLILTVALIVGVFTETGIFTALSLTLIFGAIEAMAWIERRKNAWKESEGNQTEEQKLASLIGSLYGGGERKL